MCLSRIHTSGFISRLTLLVALSLTAAIVAQEVDATADRESLTNPVYRVKNSSPEPNSVDAQSALSVKPPAKDEEPAATIATRTGTLLSAPSTAASDTEVATKPTITAQPKESTPQPTSTVAITPQAELSPSQILGQAVVDARRVLGYLETNVKDYTCEFIKRERVNGRLLPAEHIHMKVRNRIDQNGQIVQPFSVYMKFKTPKNYMNREVLFVEGANKEKILIKEGGARGRFLPSVWLNQNNRLITSVNRYNITDAGMNKMIERLISAAAENVNCDQECKVRYLQGAKVDGRVCSYLEVIRPNRKPGPLGPNNVYLAQVFVDTELNLPVRYAAYDWPTKPGGRPQIVEEYTYKNVVLNPGLSNNDFSSKNRAYRF